MGAWWRAHRKSVIAAAGAILTLAVAAAPANKWVSLVVAVATAVGVYRVPNETAAPMAVTPPVKPPAT